MKNKSIISLFVFLMSFGLATTSCEDMLTPDMDRYVENFTGRDTVNFYLGILSNVQEMIENNVILGEVRGDLCEPTDYVSDTLAAVANFVPTEDGDNGLLNRAAYYKVINQCNFYLARVDTMAQKNNIYYMRKEYAQVQAIRAWTYMQLVQNYGTVPFITRPVETAGTGWETNSPEGTVSADNLLDKLLEHDLMRAYEYERTLGLPNYGTFKTGAVDISHKLTIFPTALVLGDLYLLRGANTSDYERAAAFYYDYLEDAGSMGGDLASYGMDFNGDKETYYPVAGSWYLPLTNDYSTGEFITVVPSAANASIGKTLTRVAQIYGFDPHSSTSSTSDENTGIALSGQISVELNYKNRQIGPTPSYVNLCESQQAVEIYPSSNKIEYLENLGDCRIDGTIKYIRKDGRRMAFVQKFCPRSSRTESSYFGFSFRYNMPVYRKRQVYLRYAEAINRAGFPRHAFAILRNGLDAEKMPVIRYDSIEYNDQNSTYRVVPYLRIIADGNGFIGIDEMRRALEHPDFLDFTDESKWANRGIHSYGTGVRTDLDTLYTYEKIVGARMTQEALRVGTPAEVAKRLGAQLLEDAAEPGEGGDEATEPDRSDYTEEPMAPPFIPDDIAFQINAVETLIADEMALETAYEGWRYYDLMRMARHKNADNWGAGISGTTWMAWQIARRSMDLKPYENPTSFDGTLYGKLLDPNNWYLQSPIYK